MKAGKQMSTKTYLWIEDRIGKASYKFWTTFMHEICPEVIVESKMNNRELVKAVKRLTDTENRYIIALDNSFTGFEVSKGDLGECWRKSCCEWSDRQEDDICGLDQTGFSLNDKMKHVYWGTSLYREFKNIGLEVMV